MTTGIIEIIGAPGVGKTSLYNALCKKWKRSYHWSCQDILLSPTVRVYDFRKWLRFKLKKALKKNISASVPSDYGLKFARLHPELADFCWEHLSRSNDTPTADPGLRIRSAFHLYLDFCRYQAILDVKSSVPCIISEGLLQKSFLIHHDSQVMSNLVHQYLPLLPLPSSVIYVSTDKLQLVVNRLNKRNKKIPAHEGKNESEILYNLAQWQYLLNTIVDWMRNHGIKVYHIDAARPLVENVNILAEALNHQHTKPAPWPAFSSTTTI